MEAILTLNTAGNNTGSFNLFSDVDGFSVAFQTNVTKTQLLNGYTAVMPDYTTIVKVASGSVCKNSIEITLEQTTTTTTTITP
jgi:hypothetical protein|tara:strand:+ start:6215 stop:6463 length:249 start_codon:yes stop_codon:yes gene_type:complete